MHMQKNKPYITITPGYDNLYDDCEGCSYSAYGDHIYNTELSLGPLFSIIIPGIEEWFQIYENATDFVECLTDSSFDWNTWHYYGLQFAKEIYKQLPRNYNLYYRVPFEDKSNTLPPELCIGSDLDNLILQLGNKAKPYTVASRKDNIKFDLERKEDDIYIDVKNHFQTCRFVIPTKRLNCIKSWLEDIIDGDENCLSIQFPGCEIQFLPQKAGAHTNMGRFRITKSCGNEELLTAYVNTREFIASIYYTFMSELGFGILARPGENGCTTKQGEEREKCFVPYNILKSHKIERFIYNGEKIENSNNNHPIRESFVMFPEYGGCIFWDTMGVGSGDAKILHSDFGEFYLDVPRLQKWSEFYDNPDTSQTFEEYWKEGWKLALEVRKQLPPYIDLFYMCFDPFKPNEYCDDHYKLSKILVPSI